MGAGSLIVAGLALGSLVVPTLWRLAESVWPTEAQGHGPVILALSAWMLLQRSRQAARAGEPVSPPPLGGPAAGLLTLAWVFALAAYALGRSQGVLLLEVGALVALVSLLVLTLWGPALWRRLAFPLLFLAFLVPLPEVFVAAVTAPLKASVSAAATALLQMAGLPVGRSGVMITAGPYQLLVADACAGLHTLFTLEALGLFYLQWVGHAAVWRNVALALLLMPIAWLANVLRVVALVVVTWLWGDAAGRSFVHEAAGFTLFAAAVLLMLATDAALGVVQRRRSPRAGATGVGLRHA